MTEEDAAAVAEWERRAALRLERRISKRAEEIEAAIKERGIARVLAELFDRL